MVQATKCSSASGIQSIRIHDFTTGLDTAYNWGMFSFEQPHFLVRFLTGDTKYWMQGFSSPWLINAYKDAGREVSGSRSSRSPAQRKDSLFRYVKWNAKEENKWYRYDYYRDELRDARARCALLWCSAGRFSARSRRTSTA